MVVCGVGLDREGPRGSEVEWRIEALTGAFKKHKRNDRPAHSSERYLAVINLPTWCMSLCALPYSFVLSLLLLLLPLVHSPFFLPSAKFNSTELPCPCVTSSFRNVLLCSIKYSYYLALVGLWILKVHSMCEVRTWTCIERVKMRPTPRFLPYWSQLRLFLFFIINY